MLAFAAEKLSYVLLACLMKASIALQCTGFSEPCVCANVLEELEAGGSFDSLS